MPTSPQPGHTSCPTKSRRRGQRIVDGVISQETGETYFRSHEFRGTTECAGSAAIPHILLAETVVTNLDMAIQSQKNVVKLQITVNDTILMEVFERQANFCGIEPKLFGSITYFKHSIRANSTKEKKNVLCSLQAKLATLNVKHQVTTADVFHDEIDSSLCLETGVQIQQEWMSFFVCDQEHTFL